MFQDANASTTQTVTEITISKHLQPEVDSREARKSVQGEHRWPVSNSYKTVTYSSRHTKSVKLPRDLRIRHYQPMRVERNYELHDIGDQPIAADRGGPHQLDS